MNSETEYLTTQQVAVLTGKHRVTIRRLAKEGDIPAERFGRDWLILASDIAKIPTRDPGRPKGSKNRAKVP